MVHSETVGGRYWYWITPGTLGTRDATLTCKSATILHYNLTNFESELKLREATVPYVSIN